MKRKLVVIVISVSFLIAMLSMAFDLVPIQASNGSNLVVNGGFEEPVVTHVKNWDIYSSSEIPGWSVEWMPGPDTYDGHPRPDDAYIELHKEVFGPAAEGHQYAELDADWDGPPSIINFEPASIRIYQDLPTVAGAIYRLSFAFSPRPDVEDNKLEVKWDGTVVAILEANGTTLSNTNWTYHQYVLTATSTTTRLEFADLSESDTLGTFLDDVCVELKCEPIITCLVAGQHIYVGTVTVWNDGTYLYVKYTTTNGWVLTETHLAVATSLADIPKNETGNPIPGRFPYKMEHDPAVVEYTYAIDLGEAGFEVGDELYIAAHAVVQKDCNDASNLVVNGGFEEPVVTHAKNWDIYSSSEIPGWSVEWMPGPDTYNGHSRPADAYIELQRETFGLAPEGHQWAELDADWDGPPRIIDFEPASIRIYQDLPTIPGEEYELTFYFSPRPDTGISDNVLNVSWNAASVNTISLSGDSTTLWTKYAYTLTATDHMTRLEFADMGTADTLGTLLDDVTVTGPTFCGEETAWICGEDFPGANWAMYFRYTVCDP